MDKDTAKALRARLKALRSSEQGNTGPWPQGYRAALDDVLAAIREAETYGVASLHNTLD